MKDNQIEKGPKKWTLYYTKRRENRYTSKVWVLVDFVKSINWRKENKELRGMLLLSRWPTKIF